MEKITNKQQNPNKLTNVGKCDRESQPTKYFFS